jgi:hypothetical protein
MPISITFDNDSNVNGIQQLVEDESPGVQTGAGGSDDGNEVDVTLTAGDLAGFGTAFDTLLDTLNVGATREEYARDHDGASSSSTFVSVSTDGETVDNLFFSDADGNALDGDEVVGVTTLAGSKIYLYSDGTHGSTEDFCVAVNESGAVVAAFYLNEDTSDHLHAQIQTLTFEPLEHAQSGNDPDDSVNWTDVLNVSASGSVSFEFDNLRSGNFLWVAIGSDAAGLLATGQDLNVNDSTGGKHGKLISGGDDPCDTMNTSQGGINATIGINAQHFVDGSQNTDGAVGVFSLVTDYQALANAPQATGIDVDDIVYGGYINTNEASIFISQVTGGSDTRFLISLWEAGGNGVDMAPADLLPEIGYSAPGADDPYSYIGNQDGTGSDANLFDDVAVNVATVTIGANTWNSSNSGDEIDGVTVTIDGNDIIVDGAIDAGDLVTFTTVNDAGSDVDGTFNRFTVQALGGSGAFDIGRIDINNVIGATEAVGGDLIVDDDGPGISPAIADSTVPYAVNANAATSALNGSAGTDQLASWSITNVLPSTQSILGVTLTARIASDGLSVNIYEEKNSTDGFQSGAGGDFLYYTLTLVDALSSGGDVTGSLDSYRFAVVNAPSAQPLEFKFEGLPSGQNLFGMVASTGAPDGPGCLFFASNTSLKANGEFKNDSGTINTSQGGGPTTIGHTNQMIDDGEGIYFTIVNDPGGTNNTYLANVLGGLDQNEADDADNMDFASLREVSSSFFRVSQTQGSDVEAATIQAFNIVKPPAGPTSDRDIIGASGQNPVDIQKVNVWSDKVGGHLLETTSGLGDGGMTGAITVTIDSDGIAHVSGLEAGYVVEYFTDDLSTMAVERHDQVLITGDGGKFDIGGFGISEPQVVPDHYFDFTVQLTDGDTDFATDTFRVTVDIL